ncbi:hypothetical protein [Falsiruegeria mediterranea]|uniref:ABM domain-containing protein n=1 Tax=Falsiruegeria mediterranea M17 TaxID=1200281 RepID=A0A2R8C9X5_9RHOB|nr:hypothetical protein [Falsiruegeria mediterranea]SPJ29222.1 hypothetical protein TRM7615_02735 [Falsiruegeria mediterranea M17]
MFIRKITYQFKPEFDTEKDHKEMREALSRAFKDTEGMRSVSPVMPKVDGKYEVITVYDDEASARAATEKVQQEWNKFSHMLVEVPQIAHYGATLREYL